MDIKYEIEDIKITCHYCPTQWEGTLTDGRMIYIRYRHDYLTVSISPEPTEDIYEAVGGERIYDEYGKENYLTLDRVKVLLKEKGVILVDSKQ